MVLDIKVFDQDAIIFLLSDTANRSPNQLYGIEMSLLNLLSLLRRVTGSDDRVCEGSYSQDQRGGDASQEHDTS